MSHFSDCAFEGENFRKFRGFVAIRESFPTKFRAWRPLAWQKQAICESFLRENHIFHQFAKVFSLESFPLYGSIFTAMTLLNKAHLISTCADPQGPREDEQPLFPGTSFFTHFAPLCILFVPVN